MARFYRRLAMIVVAIAAAIYVSSYYNVSEMLTNVSQTVVSRWESTGIEKPIHERIIALFSQDLQPGTEEETTEEEATTVEADSEASKESTTAKADDSKESEAKGTEKKSSQSTQDKATSDSTDGDTSQSQTSSSSSDNDSSSSSSSSSNGHVSGTGMFGNSVFDTVVVNNQAQEVASLLQRHDVDLLANVSREFDGSSVYDKYYEQYARSIGIDYVAPPTTVDIKTVDVDGFVDFLVDKAARNPSFGLMCLDYLLHHQCLFVGAGSSLRLISLTELAKGRPYLEAQVKPLVNYYNRITSGKPDADGKVGIEQALEEVSPTQELQVAEEYRQLVAKPVAKLLMATNIVGLKTAKTTGNYKLFHIGDPAFAVPQWYGEPEFQYTGEFIITEYSIKGGLCGRLIFNTSDWRLVELAEEEIAETPAYYVEYTPGKTPGGNPPSGGGGGGDDEEDPQKNHGDNPINSTNNIQRGGRMTNEDSGFTTVIGTGKTAESSYPESAANTVDDQGKKVDNVDENQMSDSTEYLKDSTKADDYTTEGGTSVSTGTGGTDGTNVATDDDSFLAAIGL